jgi:PII-like signaling protein
MKYGGKDAVKGIRLAESFGTCRGRAFAELELIAEQKKELSIVADVVDYSERLEKAIHEEGPISSVEYIHLEDIIKLSDLRLFLPTENN